MMYADPKYAMRMTVLFFKSDSPSGIFSFIYIYIYIGNQKEGYRKNNGRGNLDPACQISFSFFFFDPHVLFTFFDDETKRTYSFVKCLGTPRYVSLI